MANWYRKRAIREKLRTIQRAACCYCEQPMVYRNISGMKQCDIPPDTETLEHLKRKSDGGTNQASNLALSCFACNHGRGSVDWCTYKSYRMGEI